uniref:Odorant-binding protein 6 n=1 Tax=Matsumurasca onukii TaxID=2912585 RepID=A0A343WGZ1_MATON|nr:odorant-binding protein 6 [Matsumurasca onukii]
MQRIIVFVVYTVGLAVAQDTCNLTMPTDPPPGECCDVIPISPFVPMLLSKDCWKKYPRPSGSVMAIDPAFKRHDICYLECVFSDNALLGADLSLNVTAVRAKFVTTDTTLSPVLSVAVTTCLSSYSSLRDPTLECQSGAGEFTNCVARRVFTVCPAARWTASTECDALRDQMTKCPTFPIKLWCSAHSRGNTKG